MAAPNLANVGTITAKSLQAALTTTTIFYAGWQKSNACIV